MQPIEVLQKAHGHLLLVSRSEPFLGWTLIWLVGAGLFFYAVFIFCFASGPPFWVKQAEYNRPPFWAKVFYFVLMGFGGFVFLVVWAAQVGFTHRAAFDRTSGTVRIEATFFSYVTDRPRLPLKNIRNAELEEGRAGSRRLILITKSEEVVLPLDISYTDKNGFYPARDAVNDFLESK